MSSEKKEFPKPLSLLKMVGPSFLILAMGLGSGEIILWPYLVANYGLGVAWGAVLGISLQFFINMEIERYALVKGESVFVGLAKIFKWTPYWFIFSTFLGFGLPGIVAASANIFGYLLGSLEFRSIAVFMLIAMGCLLTFGKTVYETMERVTKLLLMVCVPFIFGLVVIMAKKTDWLALVNGVFGIGEGYRFLPAGISLATFLGAFAYSGAGGNLNLTQSIYIKEKGYGMGKYSQKIAGLFRSHKNETVKLSGEEFEINAESISNFKQWWRKINIEHFLVFWVIGLLSMLLLMLLSYITTYGKGSNLQGISFVLNEGGVLIGQLGNWGKLFLLVLSVLLFQTQLGIMDSTSRIMGESLAILRIDSGKESTISLGRFYFGFVWAQIVFGCLVFAFNIYEPRGLIVLGAVINAFAMLVHTLLVYILNKKSLPKTFAPSLVRKIAIWIALIFFGFFGLVNLWFAFGV